MFVVVSQALKQFKEAVKDLMGSEIQVSFNLLPPKMLEEGNKRKREMAIIRRAMQSSVLTKDEVSAAPQQFVHQCHK